MFRNLSDHHQGEGQTSFCKTIIQYYFAVLHIVLLLIFCVVICYTGSIRLLWQLVDANGGVRGACGSVMFLNILS